MKNMLCLLTIFCAIVLSLQVSGQQASGYILFGKKEATLNSTCTGQGICKLHQDPNELGTIITFRARPIPNMSNVYIISFTINLNELRGVQLEQYDYFSDPTRNYVFEAGITLPDWLMISLKLNPKNPIILPSGLNLGKPSVPDAQGNMTMILCGYTP